MWREIRIFAYKQTDNQVTENSKAEATFYPLWSVDSRGAGQLHCIKLAIYEDY